MNKRKYMLIAIKAFLSNNLCVLTTEDIIANAFIELNARSAERVTEIPITTIERYLDEVGKKLISKDKMVTYNLSRTKTEEFAKKYKKVFSLVEDTKCPGIYSKVVLNNEADLNILSKKFRKNLSTDLLSAYTDEEVIKNSLIGENKLLNENIQKQYNHK